MINYHKNELINETLAKFYETFEYTLNTADYVPDKFNDKILNYIFKNMKKSFKKIDKEDKKYQRELIKQEKAEKLKLKELKNEEKKEPKKSFWQRIKDYFTRKSKKKNAKAKKNVKS